MDYGETGRLDQVIHPAAEPVNPAMMAHAFAPAGLSGHGPSWLAAGRMPHRRWPRLMESKLADAARFNDLVLLIARAQDRAAFKALFQHFAPHIKAYLMRLGAGRAQAEDLAQDAMIAVWRKAQLFDPAKASAATWIFTIARNLRIDAIRREKRPEFDPSDPAFVPDADEPADAKLAREGDESALRAALKSLPPDQAQVIELSFFADKPHSEIAKTLGLPLGTVKSRLRLAMARIRSNIGNLS